MNRKVVVGGLTVAVGALSLIANRVALTKDILEFPSTVMGWAQWVLSMFTDATPIGWTILFIMMLGLAVATSEWWLPRAGALRARYFSGVSLNRRISLVEFAGIAAKDFGWKFGNDHYESLDFLSGLKQAHIDGAIELDGRLGCDGKEEDSIIWHPLVAIPRDHLARPYWDFDVPHFFNGTRNFDISTYRVSGSAEGRFRDIHVRNKAQALEWLRADAQIYRGVAEKVETERQGRIAEWKDVPACDASDRGDGDIGLTDLFTYLMDKANAFKALDSVAERHQALDRALHDALSLGRLLSYGRPAGDFVSRMLDEISSIRIIEVAFWSNGAEIDWTTIDDTAPPHGRCVAKAGDGMTYYDLQFDRQQVEKLWPT